MHALPSGPLRLKAQIFLLAQHVLATAQPMASPRPPRRLSQAEQMEISLLIRRVEFLEARAEALDTLRQRISTCSSQLAYFQVEVERLQKVCDSLQSADNNTLHRLQPRRPIGTSGVEVLTERTLHVESCFEFVVRALQSHMPSIQWQSRRED